MYKFIDDLSPKRLDDFVQNHPSCHLLQSAAWGQAKENWQAFYVGVEEDGKLLATALILSRKLVLGKTLWYIPRGPVIDYSQTDLLEFLLLEIVKLSRKNSCAFIRIDCGYERSAHQMGDPTPLYPLADQAVLEAFRQANFKHRGFTTEIEASIQPRFVATTYAEDVKDGFSRRVRRFLKDAKSNYVEVTKEGPEALADFMFTLACTEQEKEIKLRNQAYFEHLFELYGDKVQLYLARLPLAKALKLETEKLNSLEDQKANLPENAPKKRVQLDNQIAACQRNIEFYQERREKDGDLAVLAGCFSILYGNCSEMLYAGMNRDYSKITAQFPVYTETMEEAFQKGAIKASMGGIPGTEDDGLSRFKANFSPRVIEYLGEFDYVNRPLLYWAVEILLPLFVKLRGRLGRRKR